ncbi:YheT family hydrolase [Bdellovibrio svalbardensis]|uniref:Alpha/beta fold hydrolase n=1 Tax=Bdellovibrio svalbardensis TaxID=2972972 RepID=A0ABT6DLY4_9BACT|nr:alpha/beta fold hydrolase [Bdellovibrio svalbardensis]MDG0817889.1 alpha/beta fold hydrolase [Bdellovibrio svalbardensis]
MQRLKLISCEAPFWAASGHGQTLWAHFLKSPELENLGQNFEVDLPDGDRLFCFYHQGHTGVVVSLYHGLSGDVYADYMQRTAILCRRLGHTVVLVNHRGAGHGAHHARHPYHSGRAEDVSEVLKVLRSKFPGQKQITIGYSMSGNIVLCLLGGFRGEEKPDGAITVNAPINLAAGSQLLKTGFNRVYDARFVHRLRENIKEKHRTGLIAKRYEIPWWATIHDFDQIYTADAANFRDREDYYERCSAKNYLSKIETPTYVLTAADDPFVAVREYQKSVFPKNIQLHIEPRGGHLGYLSKMPTPLGTNRWLDYYLNEALQAMTATLGVESGANAHSIQSKILK